jgi:glucose-1-phosphate adenylyltransferase
LDAYFEANLDLTDTVPKLNLYDRDWPIWTYLTQLPPPKFVHDAGDRRGLAVDSVVAQGCVVSGGQVYRSILSPGVRINSFAVVEDSILFHGVEVGRHARVRRAIIDKDVRVPPGFQIGHDPALDRARGFTRSEDGITIVAKGEELERFDRAR